MTDTATTAAWVEPIVLPFEPFYSDGNCVIYNADCRKVLPWLEPFDLLLTDPPYGIEWSTPAGPTRKPSKTVQGDDRPFEPAFVMDSAPLHVLWGGNYYTSRLPPTNAWLVWDKRVTDWSNDQSGCEFAWTSIQTPARVFRKNWGGGGCAAKENGPGVGYVHPTQKPLALMRWCLGLVPAAQTVIDPFMGSGTTLAAAKLEGRHAVGIEIDERYCELAADRLRQGVLF